jgi:aromatic-amino-acid transaminase
VQNLLFGADSAIIRDGRVVTAQALGGTGALRIGGDLIKRIVPGATVYISDPSWENHRALFEAAGFPVDTYPYYDPATRGANAEAMIAKLNTLPAGSVIVLHACCHNPTGADLTEAQWAEVVKACASRGLIPFLDMAYQGFADGIEPDAVAVNLFAASGLSFFVSSSFSKSFSLYGERVGALSIVTQSKDESARVLSQLKRVIRTNYSNPPIHGGAIVSRCCPPRPCAPSGKPNWPACVTASAPCAPASSTSWPPATSTRTSPSSSSSAACSPTPASPPPRSSA